MISQRLLVLLILCLSGNFHQVLSWAISSVRRDAALQGLTVGPSVTEVSPDFRAVFPASNFNRNVSTSWWGTQVLGESNSNANRALAALRNASFVVFNKDMYKLLGTNSYHDNKTVQTLFKFLPGPSFANRLVHDATVFSPECNCIFFAELHPPNAGYSTDAISWVWRVNLNSSSPVTEKVYPQPMMTVPNGAYHHNGSIYWAQEGNYTHPGGIVRMDPITLKTQVVLNNFLGHRFNSSNDIVITRNSIAFFTDGYYGYDNFNDTLKPEIANGVWRWNMVSGDVRQVAGAGTGLLLNPNGVALSPDEKKLYVTARGKTSNDFDGQRTIYDFEIEPSTALGPPLRYMGIFSYADAGFPDGIKADTDGRVYGSATGSVDVFSPHGELLGKINVAKDDVTVNMQWVGNWLYIAGRDYLYRVQLNSTGAQKYTY